LRPHPQRSGSDERDEPERERRHGHPFPRSARLLDGPAFERVFADPVRSSDRYFTVLARGRALDHASQAAAPQARLGLAISKRCAPRAVARNRLKRVIRESFRAARPSLPAVDVVVLCRRAAIAADNAHLRASLTAHWNRLPR
jgi:ribonuclease P protein component